MASLYRQPYFMRPKSSQSPSHHELALACVAILAPTAFQSSNGSNPWNSTLVCVARTARTGCGATPWAPVVRVTSNTATPLVGDSSVASSASVAQTLFGCDTPRGRAIGFALVGTPKLCGNKVFDVPVPMASPTRSCREAPVVLPGRV